MQGLLLFGNLNISNTAMKNDQRLDFVRAYFDKNDKNKIIPFSKQDSSMINLFSKCDCLILRKPFEKKALKNSKVNFIKFPDLI